MLEDPELRDYADGYEGVAARFGHLPSDEIVDHIDAWRQIIGEGENVGFSQGRIDSLEDILVARGPLTGVAEAS